MDTPAQWTVRWLDSIDEVDRGEWDRLARCPRPCWNWQWLHDLEGSDSISPRYGWQARHLTLWEGRELVGAAPLYLKTHSDGEFIFDQWWGQLAAEYGVDYYPKIVI